MGRKRNIFIREFFTFDSRLNQYCCKSCQAIFEGDHATNLKRHMTTAHYDLYVKEYEELEKRMNLEKAEVKKTKFYVEYSEEEVIDACVQMVCENAQPLCFFDSEPFKILTRQIFSGLKMTPVTSANIIGLLNEQYAKKRDLITSKLKDKLLSLKMDTATRKGRTVLGVNVQIIERNRLKIFTLGLRQIFGQTAEILKGK